MAFASRELLSGVKYLHEHQLAHRDIKSANVMMSVSAEIKLIDFGLCRDMADGPQIHMVGSPYWMPPEMIRKVLQCFCFAILFFLTCFFFFSLLLLGYSKSMECQWTFGRLESACWSS